jgi:hypothetical protein
MPPGFVINPVAELAACSAKPGMMDETKMDMPVAITADTLFSWKGYVHDMRWTGVKRR